MKSNQNIGKSRIVFELPEAMEEIIKQKSAAAGLSVSAYIRNAIIQHMKK